MFCLFLAEYKYSLYSETRYDYLVYPAMSNKLKPGQINIKKLKVTKNINVIPNKIMVMSSSKSVFNKYLSRDFHST